MIWALAAHASIEGPTTAVVGEQVVLEAVADGPGEVRWWRRRVQPGTYDNLDHCAHPLQRCAQPLPVRWELLGSGEQLSLTVLAGTYHLATTHSAREPTSDAPAHTLAVRTDDSYVGVLHELIGVPFVFSPAYLEAGHQTDRRLAADCVSLVIYGQRRLGRRVPYVSPHKLYQWLEPVEGPIRVGDVVHWGWQTAVVAVDHPPLGELNAADELILTWEQQAEVRPLGSLPFAGTPAAVMRWPTVPDAP